MMKPDESIDEPSKLSLLPKFTSVFLIFSIVAMVLIPLSVIVLTPSGDTGSDDVPIYDSMLLLKPQTMQYFSFINFIFIVTSILGLLILSIVNLIYRNFRTGCGALIILIIGWPISLYYSFLPYAFGMAPWSVATPVNAPDGQTYYPIQYDFWQSHDACLGVLRDDGIFAQRFKILGTTVPEFGSVSLIRPQGLIVSTKVPLMLSPDGTTLVYISDHYCYYAYNLMNHKFLGHNSVGTLSPFILINSSSPLTASDVDALKSHLRDCNRPEYCSCPSRDCLLKEMSHQNPEVRKAAQEYIQLKVSVIGEPQESALEEYQRLGGINQGQFSLHVAAAAGMLAMAEQRIASGSDVNQRDSLGLTPLHCYAACRNSNTLTHFQNRNELDDVANLLLSHGADINAKDNEGWTPLHWVVLDDYYAETVEFFLSQGAVVDPTNSTGETPLAIALRKGQWESAGLLFENGANPNIRDKAGRNSFYWLSRTDQRNIPDDIKKRLEEFKIETEATIASGNSELTEAILHHNESMVLLLVKQGVSLTHADTNGWTPLHHAIRENMPGVAQLLVEKGADIEARDQQNRTPLHHCQDGEIARMLIAKGADLEARSDGNYTPLLSAAMSGSAEVVEALLMAGADTKARNNLNQTAFETAKMLYREKVVAVMKQHGVQE